MNFNLQAYHKHVSLTGHLLGIAVLLVNRARYDALADEQRGALAAAARESTAIQRALAIAEDTDCLRLLADAGVTVIGPESIDLRGFHAAVAQAR